MAQAQEVVGIIYEGKDNVTSVARKVERSLEGIENKGKRASGSLRKSFQNAATSVAVIQGPLGAVSGRISAIGAALGRVNPAIIAFGVAFSAIGVGAAKSIREFQKVELQLNRLSGVMRATGDVSGLTLTQLDKFAKQLGRDTLTSAEQVRNAEAVLLTFTGIAGTNFKRTLRVAQDFSEIMGRDLVSSARLFGRAIQDPANNLKLLQRQLPTLTNDLVDSITSLQKAGDFQGASNKVLDFLESILKDSGKIGDAAGSIDLLRESITNMLSRVGKKLTRSTGLEKFFSDLAIAAQSADKALGANQQGQVDQINHRIGLIQERIDKLKEARDSIIAPPVQQSNQPPDLFGRSTSANQQRQQEIALKARDDIVRLDGFIADAESEINDLIKERDPLQKQINANTAQASKEVAAAKQRAADALAKRNADAFRSREEKNLQKEISAEQKKSAAEDKAAATAKASAQRRIDALIRGSLTDKQRVLDIQNQINDAVAKGAKISPADKIQVIADAARKADTRVTDLADGVSGALTDGFRSATLEAKNLGDVIDSLGAKLADVITNALIFKPLENALGSALGGAASSAGSGLFSSFFGGARAGGGSVSPGKAFLVGERGPELFVPGSGGNIVPNGAGGGGTVVNIINNTGEDVQQQTSRNNQGQELINVIIGKVTQSITQGGQVGQSIQSTFGLRRNAVLR